jgi:hypothetical protein
MGPILFTLYNTPNHSILKRHDVTDHYYADDDQKYVTLFSLDLGHANQLRVFSLSSCVGETKTWMTKNLITFNESKTDAIIVYFKSGNRKPAAVPLSIGNAPILPSESVRNLGFIIAKRLSMEKYIKNTRRVALYHLKKTAKVRKFLTYPAASQLISALVLFHIDYHPLKKIQHPAPRVITGARMRDSMTPHLRDLNLLPVPYRIDFKLAVITYRCLYGCPAGLSLRSSSAPFAPYGLVPQSARVKTYDSRTFSNYTQTVYETKFLSLSALVPTILLPFLSQVLFLS